MKCALCTNVVGKVYRALHEREICERCCYDLGIRPLTRGEVDDAVIATAYTLVAEPLNHLGLLAQVEWLHCPPQVERRKWGHENPDAGQLGFRRGYVDANPGAFLPTPHRALSGLIVSQVDGRSITLSGHRHGPGPDPGSAQILLEENSGAVIVPALRGAYTRRSPVDVWITVRR